ncbi:MAG TPA: sulfurtransferase [Candidatus Baltobacteraceae bacterium]|nr:sulfurtransferase [Candidatus Baltobacteraceae bacterium]
MPFTTFVAARSLHEHGDANWVVVDCRHALTDFSLGRKQYDEAHIPGAFFADVESDLAGPKTGKNGRHPLPDPERFAAYLRSLGANDDTQIVAYDAGGDMFAARLWVLCRWIGHEAVAVLDGGIAAWTAQGFATSAQPTPAPQAGNIVAHVQTGLVVDAAFVASHLHDPGVRILDARAADRFAGQNETVDPIAGHIPGAHNRWFKNNFRDNLTIKSPDDLRAAFVAQGEPQTIVHQCGSGVSAAANMLAMEYAGLPGSRLYAGSWSEWIADPSRPIATGTV